MHKRMLLGLALVLFLAIPLSHAEGEIAVNVEPVKNKIAVGDWAVFDVTVSNRQEEGDIFILSFKEEGVEWSVITESAYDYTSGIYIKSGSTIKTRILLKDKGLAPNPVKPYSIELNVKSLEENNRVSKLIDIYLLPEAPLNYESDLNVTPTIPRYIDPRNIYSFKVALLNNNKKSIKNLKITLESALVNREAYVELEPENRKVIDFTVSFDEETEPRIDTLTISVTEGNNTLYRETNPIEIVGYRMPFDQRNSTESLFLKDVTTITLTNKDNVEEQQIFLVQKRITDRLFTTTDPEARDIEREGKKYFAWDIKLQPDEESVIIIETDYRPLLYALLALILAVVIYFYIRDPIIVLKNCDVMKITEGGINEIKVVLVLRNRTKEHIKNLRLVDLIPKIAHVEKSKEVGTLHPNRTVNTPKGLAIEWNFDMDPKEERLVSYCLKSKLSILGGLRLPRAQVHLTIKGKKKKVRSNNIHIAGKEEELNP